MNKNSMSLCVLSSIGKINHQVLQFINSQKQLNRMHIRWGLFLEKFSYIFKHKPGAKNVLVDALSRKTYLLTTLKAEITTFDSLLDLYVDYEDFGHIWEQWLTLLLN